MIQRSIQKKAFSRTVFLGLLLMPWLAWANPSQPQAYQVELILFSHLTPEALNAEHWPILSPTKPDLSKTIQLKPKAELQAQNEADLPYFTLLPESELTLGREAKALDRDPHYETVLHIAWRQPIVSQRSAQAIHIYGGASYDDNGSALTLNTHDDEPYNTQANWQVDGTLKLSVLRYLNADFDLQFATPRDKIIALSNNDNFANTEGGLVYFNLTQDRRMRSKELNYIDYPLYGALIKVTPINSKPSA